MAEGRHSFPARMLCAECRAGRLVNEGASGAREGRFTRTLYLRCTRCGARVKRREQYCLLPVDGRPIIQDDDAR